MRRLRAAACDRSEPGDFKERGETGPRLRRGPWPPSSRRGRRGKNPVALPARVGSLGAPLGRLLASPAPAAFPRGLARRPGALRGRPTPDKPPPRPLPAPTPGRGLDLPDTVTLVNDSIRCRPFPLAAASSEPSPASEKPHPASARPHRSTPPTLNATAAPPPSVTPTNAALHPSPRGGLQTLTKGLLSPTLPLLAVLHSKTTRSGGDPGSAAGTLSSRARQGKSLDGLLSCAPLDAVQIDTLRPDLEIDYDTHQSL